MYTGRKIYPIEWPSFCTVFYVLWVRLRVCPPSVKFWLTKGETRLMPWPEGERRAAAQGQERANGELPTCTR